MSQTKRDQFNALSDYLATRRGAILQAWRKASDAEPAQTTAHSLTRGQFNDHVPEVLDAFERQLGARPGGAAAQAAAVDQKNEEVKHGLHRWQQGYRLPELMREWGHLQLCLFEEFEAFAATHPAFDRETQAEANRHMITLVNEAIRESATQYERMQQAEAAGHLDDLTGALASVQEIERRRAALIREAVHDLNGNVFGVTVAAKLLGKTSIDDAKRAEFSKLLEQGVASVTDMLSELKELARLEAGHETREITEFDAAVLVTELGSANRPIADERSLFLKVEGPPGLSVLGNPSKVRRLLQNLRLNALKYTRQGGVLVSWGVEPDNWWVRVKDTGPGLLAGPGAPMLTGLNEATASSAGVRREDGLPCRPGFARPLPARKHLHHERSRSAAARRRDRTFDCETPVRTARCQLGNGQFGGGRHDGPRGLAPPLSGQSDPKHGGPRHAQSPWGPLISPAAIFPPAAPPASRAPRESRP